MESTMKVNVAQYIIHDLSNRFPIGSENISDDEIINALVDRWSKHKYICPTHSIKFNHSAARNERYLV